MPTFHYYTIYAQTAEKPVDGVVVIKWHSLSLVLFLIAIKSLVNF